MHLAKALGYEIIKVWQGRATLGHRPMLFRWLQKKGRGEPTNGQIFARMFDLDLPQLLELTTRQVVDQAPADRAMVLIAFANTRPQIKAHKAINKTDGTALPATYTSYGKTVAMLFDKYPPTQRGDLEIPTAAEIKFRRVYHFFRAAVLGAVSERAHEANERLQAVANIWRSYIESAHHLAALIEHTKIWSKDEIELFAGESSGDGQIRNVLLTVVPDFLWQHDEMLKMAKQKFGVSPFWLRPLR